MKTYPNFNIPYDPTKRKGGVKKFRFKNKEAKKGKYAPKYDRWWEFEVKPNLLARERDLLFGTNNTEIVTDKNWRERIRDATTKEEIEDIKGIVKSRWKIDDFVHNCQKLIDGVAQNMQDAKVNAGMYSHLYESAKINEGFFKISLQHLEGKIQNQSGCWGSWNAKVALFQEAGMKYSHLITYEALKGELEKTYDKVKEEVEKKGLYNIWNWKSYSLFTPKKKPNPTPVSPPPAPSPVPSPQPNPNPDTPSYSDSDKEEITSLSETESNQKLEELKNNLASLVKKNNPNQPPLSKEEKEQKVAEVVEQINKLEEESNNKISNEILAELKAQVWELQKQLAEIKKSLKEILGSVKDYTQKLFNWFKTKNAKQLTFQDNGEILVEHNDGKKETLSTTEVKNNKVLNQFREYSQQSQQNTLSFSELNQIVSSPSSPTNEKHWDKYGKYYIGTGVVLALISAGVVIYHCWIKKTIKEQGWKKK
ncbi:MAG: hypothetical protein I3273_03370 [Candidatus Moeniiplasma glomeromycotorum]|nr:hypothetical protein [Candidatus Moeniiplasma glomeromycotorum]MCE8167741.1 hypothetical protein [Candidatus Moeniiplasma glomeromycotorum]MCE8169141.1 hypothetical protein [Candidatus Moeniiplasma glomeromycotorum]